MREMTEQQVMQKLSALCAQAEHCSYEMTEKMRRWGIEEEVQARVMARLTKEKFIDDERYCRLFVREKIKFNKWGRRKVEQALMAKRIDRGIARQVLDEVDDDEYVNALQPLLKQKRRSTRAASEYELTMKLIKFAMSRGFTMDIIKRCIEVDDGDEFLD